MLKNVTINNDIVEAVGYDIDRDYYVAVVKDHANPVGTTVPRYVTDMPRHATIVRLMRSADEFFVAGDLASGDACFMAASEISVAHGDELPVWPELFAHRETCRKGR